jgi:hypothetical protein
MFLTASPHLSFFFLFSFFLSVSFTAAHISSLQRGRTYILRVSMIYLPSVLVLLIDQIEKEFSVVRHIYPVHTQLFYTSHWSLCLLLQAQSTLGGPRRVVGIATAYRLDGPGIKFRWGRDFPHLSRPALRLTQTPVQWVSGLSRG